MSGDGPVADVWRRESAHVVGALVRRYGHFDRCEDAAQEALIAAALAWPRDGVPRNPRAWLIRAASSRLIDAQRSDTARTAREAAHAADPAVGGGGFDDSLHVVLLCCHPCLSSTSQVALTLRAVCGLSTEQVAAAFLVPVSTMAQRISRAKAKLAASGARLGDVTAASLPERVAAVRQALYLMFNEGHTASGGPALADVSLADEAIRLARQLHDRLPSDTETTGLLALLLLTRARAAARLDDAGELVVLADQDRTVWDADLIGEGSRLIAAALPVGVVGPLQLQAAIAAVHAEAPRYADTDWPQIVELYRMLAAVAPGPVVTLNRAVAVAMVDGPAAGLALVEPLSGDARMAGRHRWHAVRAHLLARAGDAAAARASYREAARLCTGVVEQRYLLRLAAEQEPPLDR